MPIIGQSRVVRSEWYDRGPLSIIESNNVNVIPHGKTTRFVYAVPVNRRTFIKSLQISMIVTISPTTGVQAFDAFTLNDDTNVLNNILFLDFPGLNLNNFGRVNESPNLLINAGDVIRFMTFDGNAGGSIRHQWSLVLTEFDA